MSTREEQTREEIIRTMSALTEALTIQNKALMRLLERGDDKSTVEIRIPAEDVQKAAEKAVATITSPDIHAPEKKARKPKAEPKAEPAPVADITPEPVVKTPTLADLRVALQACMDKHGMEKAKAALGYERLSVVPDAEIPNVIIRLQSVA